MSFQPSTTHLLILRAVNYYRQGANAEPDFDRPDIEEVIVTMPVYPVPEALIAAEMHGKCDDLFSSLADLVHRGYLETKPLSSGDTLPCHTYYGRELQCFIYYRQDDRRVQLSISEDDYGGETVRVRINGTEEFSWAWGHGLGYTITESGFRLLDGDESTPDASAKRAELRQWEPPAGLVRVSVIENDKRYRKRGKNPPRSTIQKWYDMKPPAGTDPVVKDPQTSECCYPVEWVEDRWREWKPRPIGKRNTTA